MPDLDRKSISASEAAALWNASPYLTRWMLWHKFANGVNIESGDDSRKRWGRAMQPLIVRQVAAEKKLEVIPNERDYYVRNGKLGCTRDAIIVCPDRGRGALEIKCVFDYRVWATDWRNGDCVPRHNEIQLQTQMYVGDSPIHYKWGMIAVWVCGGELYYFERRPIPELWSDLEIQTQRFFESIQLNQEPDAFGALCEAPLIAQLFHLEPGKELDFSDDPNHVKTSEDVSMFQYHKELVTGNSEPAERLRLKLLALAKDAERVRLPCGVSYRVKKSGRGKSIIPYVPDNPSPPPPPRDMPTGII